MITRMYVVSGMNCDGCVTTVKNALKNIPEVIEAQVHLSEPQAIVSMREEIPFPELQQIISESGHYSIAEIEEEKVAGLSAQPQKKGFNKIFGALHAKKDCCK
ncbi:MAG: heavy-metal-associated domain-containing protein [Chitinophagaceae bacterium]|nr:MAG: heavy-metal-associated domain-containing protein [Chitinophagaceae bacterium]